MLYTDDVRVSELQSLVISLRKFKSISMLHLETSTVCFELDDRSLGLYSLSGKTSYRKISWNLEAARFGFKLFQSLWNLAGTSAALLPRCLSNFRAIRPLQHPISRLRDFTRFGGKTSYRLVNRGPEVGEWTRWRRRDHHTEQSQVAVNWGHGTAFFKNVREQWREVCLLRLSHYLDSKDPGIDIGPMWEC